MQIRLLPILLLSCAAATAQQSLTTTFANNNGGAAGGAIYFTLTAGAADVTITDLDFNIGGAGGLAGSIDIYTTPGTHAGNELNMALWTNVATCPIAASNPAGTGTNGVLSSPLTILAGTSLGVAFVDGTLGTAHAYTTGTAPFPLSYAGCGLTLDSGTASNVPFSGALFAPRVVNTAIHYTVPDCAAVESIGDGCIDAFSSAYEMTTLDAFAQNNTLAGLDFISTGGGYIITPSAAGIAAVGSLDPLAAPLVVGGDVAVPVGSLGLVFGSNGWLATGSGNSGSFAPSPTLLLSNPAKQFSCWSDFEPNLGGTVTYEELGTQAQLTFDQVPAFGTTGANTFQFAIDTISGNASLYFGAMASTLSHPMVIGYSPAGPSGDPGSVSFETEFATNGAIILPAGDVVSLSLEGIGRPVLGPAAVNYTATTTNIESSALFHIGIVGLSNPALPLDLIGFAAGCTLYAAGDAFVGPAIVAGGLGVQTWTVIPLPVANPIFNGFELFAQAVTLDQSLVSSTARASNGIKLTIGDL